MRTRIKICGLTREEDIDAAVSAGVDAIGFVFYPKSKRYVTPTRAGPPRPAGAAEKPHRSRSPRRTTACTTTRWSC